MNFVEEDHITMLRETIRKFVAREVTPQKVAEWDAQDGVPKEVLEKMGELGICGLTFGEEYGGYGRDIIAMTAVIEELARGMMGVSGLYIAAACYGGMNIEASGSEAQKKEYLPKVAEGKMHFAYGLSEPNVGADLPSVETRGVIQDGKVIINGNKRWCSGADNADAIFVLLKSDMDAPRYNNLSFVIVPTDTPGLTIEPTRTMGARGAATCDVTFDNVQVSVDNILGGEENWNKGWNQLAGPALEAEKLEVPALALGVGEAAVAEAWEYAQERRQFGQKISGFQSIRHMLADCKTKLQASRLMLYWCAWLVENKLPSAAETSMTKMFVTETCKEVVLKCQDVMGAYGYAEGFGMERNVRDILATTIFGGSTAIQKNNIANQLRLDKG